MLFWLAVLASVDAQPMELPPLWSELECVQQLTATASEPEHLLDTDFHLFARTNVHPLLDDDATGEQFSAEYGYYCSATRYEIRVRSGRWCLRYAFGVAERYVGNDGAVRLYLYGEDLLLIPPDNQPVRASLNRSAVNRWTLEHCVPLPGHHGEGLFVIAGSVYLSRRVQQGNLSGVWRSQQFDGNLVLDSTRGLNPSETRSAGAGLHLALVLPLSERWQAGFWGENVVGRLWQRKVRRITAQVQVNTIVPDADGFLHAAPLLSGRIDDLSRDLPLQRRYTLGLAHRAAAGSWLLFASHDSSWRFALGRTLPRGWLLWHLPDREVQLAWTAGQWQVLLGINHLNPIRSKHATLSISWSLPLNR